jgi:hypothetical protein
VATMLDDRPALQLEIAGWASAELDSDGIKQYLLRNKMRAVKAEQLGEKAESLESEQDVQFTDAEQPKLIAVVYKQAKFDKPTNLIGLNKSLPVEQMRELILKNTVVTEQDLLALANLRAKRVEMALKAAGLAGERLFVTKAVINPSAEQLGQGAASRVQFKLE